MESDFNTFQRRIEDIFSILKMFIATVQKMHPTKKSCGKFSLYNHPKILKKLDATS